MTEIATIAEKALIERQKLPTLGSNTVRPSYDGLGLANIAALVTHWLSPLAPSLCEKSALPPFNPELLKIQAVTDAWQSWQDSPINHVVLLVMDGLGYDQLQTVMLDGDAPGLATATASPQAFFMPGTSVFPSTTVTALTSAATAYAPAEHGVMSTSMYMREIGSTVNFIGWQPAVAPSKTPYTDTQLNPDTLLPIPNIYLRLEKAGIHVEIVNFYQFKQTSISRFTSAGSEAGKSGFQDYLTPVDGFAKLRDRLRANRHKGKSFTYIYVSNLDSSGHRYAPLTPYYRAEVAALDFALKRELLDPLAGCTDTVLLLAADHGQRRAYSDKIMYLNEHPDLTQQMFAPATGESQCRFLHLKHGAEAAVLDYIQKHLSENFFAMTKNDAIALGLFGQQGHGVSEECRDRLGDLILLPRNSWTCYQQRWKEQLELFGVHGGLSREEMLIPFLAYRF